MRSWLNALYGVVLLVGASGLLAWVAAAGVAAWVEGWSAVDPEARFGRRGRMAVAGAVGFGMAGLSASFAGWPTWLVPPGAIAGAGLLALLAGTGVRGAGRP